MSKKVTSFDGAQRKRLAELERKVEIFEEQPAVPKMDSRGLKVGRESNEEAAVGVVVKRVAEN